MNWQESFGYKKGLLFTATDTEVGKTWLMGAIVGLLRNEGYSLGVWKPVQSGHLVDDPNGDAMRLKEWSGVNNTAREICAYDFHEPIAPVLAAKRADVPVDEHALQTSLNALYLQHKAIFIEGAGGITVSLADGLSVADLAERLQLPIIIVARVGLGTVNHTNLTVHYARSRGIPVLGVILNGFDSENESISEKENPRLIEKETGVPILGKVPWIDPGLAKNQVFQLIKKYVDIDPIRSFLEQLKN